MSEIPQDLLYTEDHEYLKPAGEPGVVYIGITDYAQGELGDITRAAESEANVLASMVQLWAA